MTYCGSIRFEQLRNDGQEVLGREQLHRSSNSAVEQLPNLSLMQRGRPRRRAEEDKVSDDLLNG